jgi:hypothetical protein
MDDWVPVVVLPNLDMRGRILCDYAAIVALDDPRMEKLRADHPPLMDFVSRFRSQFGHDVWPATLLLKADAPPSYRTAEAVTAFRDILSMSVVPYARSRRLNYDQRTELAFSSMFQFYPWMIDAKYECVILTNPALLHVHMIEEFHGQAFPEQSQGAVFETDIDLPLATELLKRWVVRFSAQQTDWRHKALFRSLNMANEAARVPALTAATLYDVGRSLALWVSAYEILAHPGGTSQSNFGTVSTLIEKVEWIATALAQPQHQVGQTQRPLATWLNRKIYDLRNDFLHGNDVDGPALNLNGKSTIDFAACLYRLALTGFLNLNFTEPEPAQSTPEHASFRQRRTRFWNYQRAYEEAIRKAVA